MKLSIDYNTSRYTIKGYETGSVTINNKQYSDSLIVTPEQLISPWEPDNHEDLDQGHIEFLINMKPRNHTTWDRKKTQLPPPFSHCNRHATWNWF